MCIEAMTRPPQFLYAASAASARCHVPDWDAHHATSSPGRHRLTCTSTSSGARSRLRAFSLVLPPRRCRTWAPILYWVMMVVRLADRSSKVSKSMCSQGSAASSIQTRATLDMIGSDSTKSAKGCCPDRPELKSSSQLVLLHGCPAASHH